MSYVIVEYPPAILALSKEVAQHPEIWELMNSHPATDWAARVGAIAAYCGLILDGAYVSSDIEYIARKCTEFLYQKRTSIILPVH